MSLKFLLILPILEIITFILFGDFFGFFPVLFMILISGFFGLFLLKSNIDIDEVKEITSRPEKWMYKKLAGILLIIPGFVTDILGLILLIKSFRTFVWDFFPDDLKNKVYPKKKNNEEIIEVEYRDLDDK